MRSKLPFNINNKDFDSDLLNLHKKWLNNNPNSTKLQIADNYLQCYRLLKGEHNVNESKSRTK